MTMPDWLDELLASVCEACVNEVKGRTSGLSCRWAEPENNVWEAWLLEVAPSVVEISGGKDDGETVFDFVDVDLLALPQCLDEVEWFDYDPDYGNTPHLSLGGKRKEYEVVVQVYFEPFEGDEAQTIFDVKRGGWRDKEVEGE
jgi:hypothetical protein